MLLPVIKTRLLVIQLVTLYLRKVHVDSTQIDGGTSENPFQGVCQGNGSIPGLFILVWSFLVQYLIQEVHTVDLVSPISGINISMADLIFVNNTNITTEGSAKEEVCTKVQAVSRTYTEGLIVTRGGLQPTKWLFQMTSFGWCQVKFIFKQIDSREPIIVTNMYCKEEAVQN